MYRRSGVFRDSDDKDIVESVEKRSWRFDKTNEKRGEEEKQRRFR